MGNTATVNTVGGVVEVEVDWNQGAWLTLKAIKRAAVEGPLAASTEPNI